MNHEGEQRLDQIVFRWEGNRGRTGTGITAVAYSCERARAEELREELAPLLQTEGTGQPSQVRHVRPGNGEVVVINRRRGPDAHGRASTESHALIGNRDVLKARLCLTLGQLPLPGPSDGLYDADPARSLPTLGLDDLKHAAEPAWQRFTARVGTVREPLAAVAAQLLRTPDHLMSVRIPEFSAEHTNDTPLLIWGLCGIFGSWLGRDFWTYATYDTTDSHALRVMGVPHWRTSAVEDLRLERIALRSAPDDEAQYIAAELVRRFLPEPIKAAEVRRVLSQCPTGAALPTGDRLRTLTRLLETPLPQPGGWAYDTDDRPAPTAAPAGEAGAGFDGTGSGQVDPVADWYHDQSAAGQLHAPSPLPAPTPPQGSDDDGAPVVGAHPQAVRPTGDEPNEAPSPYLPDEPLRPLPEPLTLARGVANGVLPRGGHDRPAPAGGHGGASDAVLLTRLDTPDLSRQKVDRLLEALASGTRRRTLWQARYLGRRLLWKRLYLRHDRRAGREGADGQDPRRAAETAFWLLHWAVLPYVGYKPLAEHLVSLIRDACKEDGPVERHFLRLIAFAPAYGVPNLPSEAWWELVQYLHRAGAGELPEPQRAPRGRRADRRQARAEAERALPSDDRWRIFFLGMTCVAVLLFLLLMLTVWW
ncbi:hypothetical protein [Streptomyces sp. NPDC096132]|uniref:hypothetical protein n=1 Tax=Streptomyces sp. NPDC096132 TaxID=3366075 RepID=UPI00382AD527